MLNICKDTGSLSAPSGWSVLKHIRTQSGSLVFKDPGCSLIKGLRYDISVSKKNNRKIFTFEFESWSYGARGAIQHAGLLSYNLQERLYPDPRISHYISELKVLKRQVSADDISAASVLKTTSDLIRVVDECIFADGLDILFENGLIEDIPLYMIYNSHKNLPDFDETGQRYVS